MNKKHFGISKMFIPRIRVYLILIFLLLLSIAYYRPDIWYICLLFMLAVMYYSYIVNKIRGEEISKYIENLTINIDAVTKDTLLNFSLPLVVVELNGNKIWGNAIYEKNFKNEEIYTSINEIIEEINFDEVLKTKRKIYGEITYQGRDYEVLGNFIRIDKEHNKTEVVLMLYFIDVTEHHELIKKI